MFRICNSKYSSSTHVTKMPNTTRTMITTRSLTVTIINNGQVISDQPSPQGGDSLYQTWDNMFRNLEPFCRAYAMAHTPQVLHTTSMYQQGNDFDKSISLNVNGICVLVTPV